MLKRSATAAVCILGHDYILCKPKSHYETTPYLSELSLICLRTRPPGMAVLGAAYFPTSLLIYRVASLSIVFFKVEASLSAISSS